MAQGDNAGGAITSIKAAIGLYCHVLVKIGKPIPEDRQPTDEEKAAMGSVRWKTHTVTVDLPD